jgi:hypothetical protein
MFVVGHEYAHLLPARTAKTTARPIADREVQAIRHYRQQGFESGRSGAGNLDLCGVLHGGGFDAVVAYWSIPLILAGLELAEQATGMVARGVGHVDIASSTHPPVVARRAMLDAPLKALMGPEQARAPLEVAGIIERIFHCLWDRIETRMIALHDAGMPLAPIWRQRGLSQA